MTQGGIGGGRLVLVLGAILLLFMFGVVIFAQAQNVWIDESTQLSGMTLSPGRLIAWLAGDHSIPFGVPADRMPPVSYLLDIIGWRIWGSNVLAMRLYHAAIAGVGLVVLLIAVARRFDLRTALVTGLILALSPKLVETAVEIRAYPIFFALSCAQVALLIGGDVAARPRRLILFLLLSLASGYTHFFGVVSSSAFFLAVLADAPNLRSAIRAVIGYAVVLLLWLGLIPFIMGAASISTHGEPVTPGPGAMITFTFRLLGTSSQMVKPVVALLYFTGATLLVLLALIGLGMKLARDRLAIRHDPAIGLGLVLVAGIVVCIGAAFVIAGFNTLSPRYNIWMLPPLAVLIALAAEGVVTPAGKVARIARLGALAIFAVGAIWGYATFLTRADWFVHGPSSTLEAMLTEAGPDAAVVHIGTTWEYGFYPLYWRHRDSLPQWLLASDGQSVVRITQGGDITGTPQPLSALAGYSTVLVSRVELQNYEELRALDRPAAFEFTPGEVAPTLAYAGWRSGDSVVRPGNYSFIGQLYRKLPTPSPASSTTPASTDAPH